MERGFGFIEGSGSSVRLRVEIVVGIDDHIVSLRAKDVLNSFLADDLYFPLESL